VPLTRLAAEAVYPQKAMICSIVFNSDHGVRFRGTSVSAVAQFFGFCPHEPCRAISFVQSAGAFSLAFAAPKGPH